MTQALKYQDQILTLDASVFMDGLEGEARREFVMDMLRYVVHEQDGQSLVLRALIERLAQPGNWWADWDADTRLECLAAMEREAVNGLPWKLWRDHYFSKTHSVAMEIPKWWELLKGIDPELAARVDAAFTSYYDALAGVDEERQDWAYKIKNSMFQAERNAADAWYKVVQSAVVDQLAVDLAPFYAALGGDGARFAHNESLSLEPAVDAALEAHTEAQQ